MGRPCSLDPILGYTCNTELRLLAKDLIETLDEVLPPKLDLMGLIEETLNASHRERFVHAAHVIPMLTRERQADVEDRIFGHSGEAICGFGYEVTSVS
jgi:hypothetical protein